MRSYKLQHCWDFFYSIGFNELIWKELERPFKTRSSFLFYGSTAWTLKCSSVGWWNMISVHFSLTGIWCPVVFTAHGSRPKCCISFLKTPIWSMFRWSGPVCLARFDPHERLNYDERGIQNAHGNLEADAILHWKCSSWLQACCLWASLLLELLPSFSNDSSRLCTLPSNKGQIFLQHIIPPRLVYWPSAVSSTNSGMPQVTRKRM